MKIHYAIVVTLVGVLTGLTDGNPAWCQALSRHEFGERHMGVDVKLTLYAPTEPAANDAAARAFARIAALDRTLSDYNADSEAQRLCQNARPGVPVPVSADLLAVLQASHDLSRRSEGAFDVTIAPLVKLWRRARRQKQLPDPKLLAEARALVDYRQVVLDSNARTVTFQRPGLQLDFGGIAKGYAAQQALRTLKDAGISRALVALAGDIAAGDAPPDAPGWKIGIAPLGDPNGPPSRWLNLHNACVSTSGDAFQAVEIDGVRYSHIVDPKTGLGLTHSTSVTVIAADGLIADGLDTAANLLGPEAGMKLIASTPSAAGLFVTQRDGKVQVYTTPRFDDWLWRDAP